MEPDIMDVETLVGTVPPSIDRNPTVGEPPPPPPDADETVTTIEEPKKRGRGRPRKADTGEPTAAELRRLEAERKAFATLISSTIDMVGEPVFGPTWAPANEPTRQAFVNAWDAYLATCENQTGNPVVLLCILYGAKVTACLTVEKESVIKTVAKRVWYKLPWTKRKEKENKQSTIPQNETI